MSFLFCAIIGLGLFLSNNSIPNQEGYFEGAWKLSHINFTDAILSPATTPLIFLTGMLIERVLGISLANAWKIMDLVFAGFIGVFLIYVYWKTHKPTQLFDLATPVFIILSSLGFIYSFTSMSGEGMPIFFALVGIYLWQKRSFKTASLLFILSFLSKFTLYLIAPGVGIWTLVQLKSYSKKEIREIVIASMMFLAVFFTYHTIKQWGDIKLQTQYISNFSPSIILNNFPIFFIAVLLGAPLVAFFAFVYPSISNVFWLAGFSSLIMLSRRYFYWNHPQQIIVFWMLYFFSHQKSKEFLQKRFILLQIIFSLFLVNLLPVTIGNNLIFYKHITKQESFAIDNEIKKDYHGGKIGYYLNRRFDEPFPNYEISYMEHDWDFVVEDTEYIVVPTGLIPEQIVRHKQCRLIYYATVKRNMIYQVKCEKKLT